MNPARAALEIAKTPFLPEREYSYLHRYEHMINTILYYYTVACADRAYNIICSALRSLIDFEKDLTTTSQKMVPLQFFFIFP